MLIILVLVLLVCFSYHNFVIFVIVNVLLVLIWLRNVHRVRFLGCLMGVDVCVRLGFLFLGCCVWRVMLAVIRVRGRRRTVHHVLQSISQYSRPPPASAPTHTTYPHQPQSANNAPPHATHAYPYPHTAYHAQ